jgi:putative salt-induced outer membrane protein YdiY
MAKMQWGTRLAAVVIAAAGASWAPADEVVFNNGDKLTGKVTGVDSSKLTIKSTMAGDITTDLAKVRSFTVERPMEVRLRDGTISTAEIMSEEPGVATLRSGEVSRRVPHGDLRSIRDPQGAWSGSLRAGATVNRGNSNTATAVAGYELQRRFPEDRVTSAGEYNYGRDRDPATGEDDTTVDHWRITGKYDHFISAKWYGYLTASAERDNIADLRLRLAPGAGAGYQWLEGPRTNIGSEVGLSFVHERYGEGERNEYLASRLAYNIDHKLADRVKAIHKLEYLPSLQDTGEYLLNTDAGVRVDLTGHFFAEMKLELRYNSAPPEGTKSTDMRYVTSLGWCF